MDHIVSGSGESLGVVSDIGAIVCYCQKTLSIVYISGTTVTFVTLVCKWRISLPIVRIVWIGVNCLTIRVCATLCITDVIYNARYL